MSRFWQHFISNGGSSEIGAASSQPNPEENEALDAYSRVVVRVADNLRPAVVNLRVGKGQGSPFGFRQALHLDHRHLVKAEQNCRRIAAVASNDEAALVNQDGDQKAEGGDAVGNLADLLLRVGACVTHIGFDRLDCDPLHTDHKCFPSYIEAKRPRFDLRWLRTTLRCKELRLGSCHADRIADLCGSLLTDCQSVCSSRPSASPR